MARLIYKFKQKVLDIVPLAAGQGITIGRHHNNTIAIDNLAVSGFHARVDMNPDGVLITDLESKNGTYVNGERIDEGPLNHEDAITVGKHTLLLDLHDEIEVQEDMKMDAAPQAGPSPMSDANTMFLENAGQEAAAAEETPPEPVPEPIYAQSDNLAILEGGQGEISLSKREVTIGSDKEADIPVGGLWGLLVGSNAVTISKQATDYFLRYTGGLIKPKRNGTSVKGTIKLNHEDVVELGPVRVKVQLSKRETT